jgi:methionyl-tRNA formyltransferase
MTLRAVFFGSPEFSIPSLRALHRENEVVAVVTQPDRSSGRGRTLTPPPVKRVALELGLRVFQPERLRRRSVREELTALGADVFVVVAYGQILSPRLLAVPQYGCVNVHGSLLPKYRGAAPIQWAVLNGESETGITIMQMDAGVDTGPMLRSHRIDLNSDETAGSLHDRLAPLGAELMVETLASMAAGKSVAEDQNDADASMAPMLSKADGRVDFSGTAFSVDHWIRGMDPWPSAFTSLGEATMRLFGSEATRDKGAAGEVLDCDERGLLVACGEGAVRIRELQLPGRRRMRARDLTAGKPIPSGTILGT